MTQYTLVIGNKNYSSWSMRAWLAMKQVGIVFDEVRVPLFEDGYKATIEQYSPAGKVPVLVAGNIAVWESLAICEFIAERHPEKRLWPADSAVRAQARAICSEMHAGFSALRNAMPMNIRSSHPGKGMTPEAKRDIGRITAIWEQCRNNHGSGGELLFGHFTAADAFYAPVVSRFETYAVKLPRVARAYADAVLRLSAMQEWMTAARREAEFVAEDEPVRNPVKVYAVGGSVRDELLGLPVADRDYVVVGATPEQMVKLGYRPVGKDFPVFLHPQTHEEYALARAERKTARGYTGFEFRAAPDVTLEEDLARRDLTINAIARDEAGNIIDPFGGVTDLKAGVLRHVGPAFVEDPVRILRVARFAARFGFSIAPETLELMQRMVESGEADALVAERVWQELARGLMEQRPSHMVRVLRACGALALILPELEALFGVPQPAEPHPEVDTGEHMLLVLDYAAAQGFPLEVRFAALAHDLGKGATPRSEWPHHIGHEERGAGLARQLCERLRVPHQCRDLALLAARYHGMIHRALELKPATLLKLLQQCDALRKPRRFAQLLDACACDFHGRTGYHDRPYPQVGRLQAALAAAQAVDSGAVAKRSRGPQQIRERVAQARTDAIRKALAE